MAQVKALAANFEHKEIHIGIGGAKNNLIVMTPKNKRVFLSFNDITQLERVSDANVKNIGSSFGGAAIGALAFGGAGLIAGALASGNKTEVTFHAEFRGGEKLMGIVPLATFQAMQGEVMQQTFGGATISHDEDVNEDDKRAGPWFWVGVAIVPVVFAWFTLQKKYTLAHRVIAFGWMATTFAMAMKK